MSPALPQKLISIVAEGQDVFTTTTDNQASVRLPDSHHIDVALLRLAEPVGPVTATPLRLGRH